MKKKLILGLLLVTIVGLPLIYYYFIAASNNGFRRNWKKPVIKLNNIKAFDEKIYFAFKPYKDIWLSKRHSPLELFCLDDTLGNLKKVKLLPPPGFDISLCNYYFNHIDSGLMVTNERTQLACMEATEPSLYHASNLVSDDPATMSRNTVVVRSFKHEHQQRYLELVKLELWDSARVINSFRIPKQIDGVFCADGKLQYDPINCHFFYMYYHRGGFICLDTNLTVLYEAKTIDTVQIASVKYSFYNKKNKSGHWDTRRMLSTPPNLVNKYYSVDSDRIYILSGVRSDDQNFFKFMDNSTIDVYSIENGDYLFSFLLPKFEGKLLKQFHIKGNQIFAVYDKNLVTYKF